MIGAWRRIRARMDGPIGVTLAVVAVAWGVSRLNGEAQRLDQRIEKRRGELATLDAAIARIVGNGDQADAVSPDDWCNVSSPDGTRCTFGALHERGGLHYTYGGRAYILDETEHAVWALCTYTAAPV